MTLKNSRLGPDLPTSVNNSDFATRKALFSQNFTLTKFCENKTLAKIFKFTVLSTASGQVCFSSPVVHTTASLVKRVCTQKIIFSFLNQNICCGYSKEQSQRDGSFKHPKHMLNLLGKQIFTILCSKYCLFKPMIQLNRKNNGSRWSTQLLCQLHLTIDPVQRKIVIIFLPINSNICFWGSKETSH